MKKTYKVNNLKFSNLFLFLIEIRKVINNYKYFYFNDIGIKNQKSTLFFFVNLILLYEIYYYINYFKFFEINSNFFFSFKSKERSK